MERFFLRGNSPLRSFRGVPAAASVPSSPAAPGQRLVYTFFSAFSFLFLVGASSGRKKSRSPARLARRELRNRSLSAIRARDRLCESPPLPMTAARAGAFCRQPPGAHDSSVRTSFVAPAFLGRVAGLVGAVVWFAARFEDYALKNIRLDV